MAICRSCNAQIDWVKTANGKNMPVDLAEFPVIPDAAGDILAVDQDGQVFRGKTCSESEEAERYQYARLSHFATCPNAAQHRRKEP